MKKTQNILITIVLFAGFLSPVFSQNISGVSQMNLTAPATAEQKDIADQTAADSLRNALFVWVSQNLAQAPNISNAIEKKHFNTFAKSCVKKAKKESIVDEHDWILSLNMTSDQVKSAVGEHNDLFDSQALQYWKVTTESLNSKQLNAAFNAGIHTLYYALGHIGAPLKTPGDTTSLSIAARFTLQKLLKRIKVAYSSPVIKGKPSEPIESKIIISATIDSLPFAGLPLICQLSDGRELLTVTTDAKGTASLDKLKMPFVAYGTFLYIRPNFGVVIDPAFLFSADDFGLKLFEGQDQTLIFNLIKPVYNLEYSVTAANDVDIPPDFSSGDLFEKFLKDSLHMQRVSGELPDISIQIQCQITSYRSDEKETTRLKAEVKAAMRQLKSEGTKVEKTTILNDKEYAHSHEIPKKMIFKKEDLDSKGTIPIGLFFWETSNALRDLVREMLSML